MPDHGLFHDHLSRLRSPGRSVAKFRDPFAWLGSRYSGSCSCCFPFGVSTLGSLAVLQVSRVQDSYSLAQIHRCELMGREWHEYHPTRVMDFRNISLTPKSYEQWMRKAVYEGEMRCVGKLAVDADNCIPDLRSDGDPYVREDWQLFTRSLSSTAALKLSARPETADLNTFFDKSTPAAAEGMTMGFIPKGTVPVETAVRFRTWNVGVMPNNHARIILQIPCYFDCFQNFAVFAFCFVGCGGVRVWLCITGPYRMGL